MTTLSTLDVNRLLDAVIPSSVRVLGTFPADKVPTLLSDEPCCFVLNTHPDGQPGQHWLAFHYDGNGALDYFDSYGFPLVTHKHVYDALLTRDLLSICKPVSTIELQSRVTSVCGQYCVLFLYWRAKHPHALAKQFAAWVFACGGSFPVERDSFVLRHLGRLVARCTASAVVQHRTSVASCSVQTCCCRCI